MTRPLNKKVEDLTGISSYEKPGSPLRTGHSWPVLFSNWIIELERLTELYSPTEIHGIGHNLPFDCRFIDSENKRNNVRFSFQKTFTRLIDTRKYAEGIPEYPHNLKLTKAANCSLAQSSVYFGLFGADENSHNALHDCLNLMKITHHKLFPSPFKCSRPQGATKVQEMQISEAF